MASPGLVLGTAQLGDAYGIANRRGRLADGEAEAILRAAIDLGTEWLDTAPSYGDAEARIGRMLGALHGADRLRICSKLPPLDMDARHDEVAAAVLGAIDDSRRALGRDCIDAYLIHSAADLVRCGDAIVDALASAQAAGRIAVFGLSIYDPEDARHFAAHHEMTAVQYPFNAFDRRTIATGCLDALADRLAHRHARSALLQGLLVLDAAGLPSHVAGAAPWLGGLHSLLADHGVEPLHGAIGFAAQRSGADGIVLGVDSAEQLYEVSKALTSPLTPALSAEIDARFGAVPDDVRDPRRWGAVG
jgi:aryl-alcohol dehydrogenase-like predicted oxidoreductase